MILSPEQAKRLACPYRNAAGKPLTCVANDCAGWRWADQTTAHGYCGPAGEPQVYRVQNGSNRPPHGRTTVLTSTARTIDRSRGVPESFAKTVAAEFVAALTADQPDF